jgi:drug/metabolite transporter (DMT)-like permease
MFELIKNNPNTSTIPLILVTTFLAVGGQLSLKHGMTSIGSISGFKILLKSLSKVATNLWVIGGLALYVFSTLLWMMILTKTPLSFCYPFISLSYVFVIIASRLIFRERIDQFKIFAIILIVAGVVLLSMSGSGGAVNGR